MRKLTYRDIQDLPQDHPDYIRFMQEAETMSGLPVQEMGDDEESVAYFDRYIAGDR